MKKLARRIDIRVSISEKGYRARAIGIKSVIQASSIPELYKKLLAGLNQKYAPLGYEVDPSNLHLSFDLQQFFQHYRVINAKVLASRIGMNPSLLSQYVRGKKEPSQKQVLRIMAGLQEIGRELALVRLT